MAETASVFGEILVTSALLSRASDPLAQRELIANALDDIYATVLRQAYFVLFEIEAHAAIVEGCTPDQLDEIYLANLHEQFGESVDVSPEFAKEWLAIPHFYSTPFYCYAYSFGQLLVLALYQRFLDEGESFKPGYLDLLAYGGAAAPEAVLAEAGIDITEASFWRGGFAFVESLLDRLEAIPT
jgi:oligoendopeptidase F